MKRSSLLIWLLAIALILTALPAYAGWEAAGLKGEDVTALAEDPGDATAWYAGTASGNVYKFTADTWALRSNGLPAGYPVTSIGVDSLNPSTVYAALGEAGIYRTLDGGDNWAYFDLLGAFMAGVKVDPYNSSILFAISKNKVFRSVGGGLFVEVGSSVVKSKDIREITFNPPDYELNPLPLSTDVLYVASTGGMYKSVDGGDNWARLDTESSGIATVNFTALAADPCQPDVLYAGTADAGIYKSADGGATWTGAGNGLGAGEISAITFYPMNTGIILAGTASGEIYRTDSGGQSWYAWGSGFGRVSAIKFVYPQSTYILAGTLNGVVSYDLLLSDFVVSSVIAPAEVRTLETITVTSTVATLGGGFDGHRNETSAPTHYYDNTSNGIEVRLYLSADGVLDDGAGEYYLGHRGIYDMAPGGSDTAATSFTISHTIPEGTYYVAAKILRFGNVIEADETNNASTGNQVTITP